MEYLPPTPEPTPSHVPLHAAPELPAAPRIGAAALAMDAAPEMAQPEEAAAEAWSTFTPTPDALMTAAIRAAFDVGAIDAEDAVQLWTAYQNGDLPPMTNLASNRDPNDPNAWPSPFDHFGEAMRHYRETYPDRMRQRHPGMPRFTLTALAFIERMRELGYSISSGAYSEIESGISTPKNPQAFLEAAMAILALEPGGIERTFLVQQLSFDLLAKKMGTDLTQFFFARLQLARATAAPPSSATEGPAALPGMSTTSHDRADAAEPDERPGAHEAEPPAEHDRQAP